MRERASERVRGEGKNRQGSEGEWKKEGKAGDVDGATGPASSQQGGLVWF